MADDFKSLDPNQMVSLFDNDEKQRMGGAFAASFSTLDQSNLMSPRKNDISLGSYFHPRSSLPFSSMLESGGKGSERYPKDPPEQDNPRRVSPSLPDTEIGRCAKASDRRATTSSFMGRMDNSCMSKVNHADGQLDQSLSQLANFFADPENRMSSSAIIDHVLDYCRNRPGSSASKQQLKSRHSTVVQEILETRKRTSQLFMSADRSTCFAATSTSMQKSESYATFSQELPKGHASRCSTPDSLDSSLGPSASYVNGSKAAKRPNGFKEPLPPRAPLPHRDSLPSKSQNGQIVKKFKDQDECLEEKDNHQRMLPENVQLQIQLPPELLGKHAQGSKPVLINLACPTSRPGSSASSVSSEIQSGPPAIYRVDSPESVIQVQHVPRAGGKVIKFHFDGYIQYE